MIAHWEFRDLDQPQSSCGRVVETGLPVVSGPITDAAIWTQERGLSEGFQRRELPFRWRERQEIPHRVERWRTLDALSVPAELVVEAAPGHPTAERRFIGVCDDVPLPFIARNRHHSPASSEELRWIVGGLQSRKGILGDGR